MAHGLGGHVATAGGAEETKNQTEKERNGTANTEGKQKTMGERRVERCMGVAMGRGEKLFLTMLWLTMGGSRGGSAAR